MTKGWVGWLQRLAAAVAVLAPAALAACGEAAEGNKSFRVVTTFTVTQDIAQNVAGDKAIVESITKPGAEIHDYQPTPLDIVKAQDADLVPWSASISNSGSRSSHLNVLRISSRVDRYKVDQALERVGMQAH